MHRSWLTASCSILALCYFGSPNIVMAQDVASTQENIAQRPNINPYNRDIVMTVPLSFNSRSLGELEVLLTADDRFFVFSEGFNALISPLLTDVAKEELNSILNGVDKFESSHLEGGGIMLEYDPNMLSLMVLRIDPSKRAVERLFDEGRSERPGVAPEKFSAYLNTAISGSYVHSTGEASTPSAYFTGAARFSKVVLESEFVGQENSFGGDYEFSRRYARAVYDQPEAYRRWWAGDLEPEIRGRQGYSQLGGIGVARQRQRFDTYRSNVLSGGRQIVLQENSTVRVLRNGVFLREFRLDAGQYDLSNLPLTSGSNDIQLEIVGASGRADSVGYSAYLDMIDLDPGDYEYGAFLGLTNTGLFGGPNYSDGDLALTGYWRKAFENKPALGFGLQARQQVQNISGQTQFILRNGGRLRLDGALSRGDAGEGFVVAGAFDHYIDRAGEIDVWNVSLEYVSEKYSNINNFGGFNANDYSLSAGYTRRINESLTVSFSGGYRSSRTEQFGDSYSINIYSIYNLTPRIGLQFGVDYTDFGFDSGSNGLGFNVSLSWVPSYSKRFDARYNSSTNSASARYNKSSENRVGAWGYSIATNYEDGPANVTGQIDYIGNRFDGSLMHSSFGQDFDTVTDLQITGARISTSLAFVGGKFALSRPIYDSFAMIDTHESLGDRSAIIGDSFEGGRYHSRSGLFGPAVNNTLTSYVNQSVYYDVIDVPPGYDIGEGVMRVRPAYRSGYLITAGSDAFVSAMGRLVGRDGGPASLVSGRVLSLDDSDEKAEVFFTNSAGRFSIQKLTPGRRYKVEIFTDPEQSFEFEVPNDNEGLLDLNIVTLPLYTSVQ